MKLLAAAPLFILLAACATQEIAVPPAAFRVGWTGMPDNSMLPQKSAGNLKASPNCLGDNVSPPIQWSNAPDKTRSFVIFVDDQAGRVGLGVSHMVVYGIPSTLSSFAEGELSAAPQGGRFVARQEHPRHDGLVWPVPAARQRAAALSDDDHRDDARALRTRARLD
jgi:hypothetical protein